MKKFEIWKMTEHDDEVGMLIPVDEIEQMVGAFGDASVYRLDEKATDERIEELNRQIKEYAEAEGVRYLHSCALDFLDEKEIEYKGIGDRFYTPEGNIVFAYDEFMSEDILDTFPVYTWWDGSNWKQIERPDEYGEVTELEYDEDEEECLDEWDGNNYTSGHVGVHHYMVRMGEDRVLMIYRSQWQGDHTTAEILTDAQYAEYRKGRGMDE